MDEPLLKDTELEDATVRKLARHGKTNIYQLAETSEYELGLFSLRDSEIQDVKDLLARHGRRLVGD